MIRLSLALAVALTLTACGHSQPVGVHEQQHGFVFDTATESLIVPSSDLGLTELDLLLARNNARYGDRLVVDTDAATLEALRQRYALTGIRVIPAPGGGGNASAIRATFVRLLVTPPACGDWSDGTKVEGDNRPAANWGCASAANLAHMIADPNDLVAGRAPMTAYNAQADTVAIRAYRAKTISWELAPGGTTGD